MQTLGGLSLLLREASGNFLGLQMISCPLGLAPKLRVLAGDRGNVGAEIGYFPLGGTVFLYLPSQYEILIGKNQNNILAGLTALAGIKS